MWRNRPSRAFTLLEVVVALLIMSLLMGVVVPRLIGSRKREFESFVHEVSDLLRMYSHRDHLDRRPIGLRISDAIDAPGQLELVVLDTTDPDATWQVDRHVRPVRFPFFIDRGGMQVRAQFDPGHGYESVNIDGWVLSHNAGENRPSLVIEIQDDSGEYRETLTLPSHAIAPRTSDLEDGRGPIDLDSEGRSREDW